MSEYRDAKRDQPAPKQGIQNVTDAVIADLKDRTEFGTKKYGRPLETHNGRDALLDAYQEAVDLALYLKQAVLEGKPNKCIAGTEWAAKAQADYGGACGGGKSCLLTAKAEADAELAAVLNPMWRINQLTEALAKSRKETYEMTESRDSYAASLRNEQEKVAASNKLLKEMTHHRDFLSTSLRVDRENASERIGGLGRQVDGLQKEISERDAAIAKLTKQANELRSFGVDHWKAVADRSAKSLAESEDRRLGLAGELRAAQDSIQSLRETIAETEKQRLNLFAITKYDDDRIAKLVKQVDSVKSSRDHWKFEADRAARHFADSQKLVSELRASITERDTRITNFAKDVAGYKTTIALAVNDRDRAYRDIDVLIRKTETLLAERDAAIKKAASHDEAFGDCIARINDLIGRNDTLREKLWNIERKLGCPISPECGPGRTCPCFPAAV